MCTEQMEGNRSGQTENSCMEGSEIEGGFRYNWKEGTNRGGTNRGGTNVEKDGKKWVEAMNREIEKWVQTELEWF